MKYLFFKLAVIGALCSVASPAFAVEWVNVTQNDAGDRFFIDTSSVLRKDDNVWYWEYREFPQANNAFLDKKLDKPVHGVVLNWSANCVSKTQRLRQATAYDKDRGLIERFSYGDTGELRQAQAGSSSAKVLNYACTMQQSRTTPPASGTAPAKSE